ncbi:Hypothetical predicted protein [Octopus vulgaris]|uniref:Uncharacterized protein n=1 Tax=Octopus vulgaris TaxID=6645 RepID=A0AA36BRL3_OCTVU|nr:Hypothetical predicted protein [Octopus vulgaris]
MIKVPFLFPKKNGTSINLCPLGTLSLWSRCYQDRVININHNSSNTRIVTLDGNIILLFSFKEIKKLVMKLFSP